MTAANESLDCLIEQLSASRQSLLQAISGVSEQQFKRRPVASDADPEPWCIAEVLAHLLIDEKLWTQRVSIALEQDGAEVEPSDREQAASWVRNGRSAPVPQLIHGLLAARRDLELLLQNASGVEQALIRSVLQPKRGVLSVEWMVRKVIEHEIEHVAHIDVLRQETETRTPRVEAGN